MQEGRIYTTQKRVCETTKRKQTKNKKRQKTPHSTQTTKKKKKKKRVSGGQTTERPDKQHVFCSMIKKDISRALCRTYYVCQRSAYNKKKKMIQQCTVPTVHCPGRSPAKDFLRGIKTYVSNELTAMIE